MPQGKTWTILRDETAATGHVDQCIVQARQQRKRLSGFWQFLAHLWRRWRSHNPKHTSRHRQAVINTTSHCPPCPFSIATLKLLKVSDGAIVPDGMLRVGFATGKKNTPVRSQELLGLV